MSHKGTDFPQYRMLSNEKVFYRIRSDREFDEVQLIGARAMWFSMVAQQYPEILKIQDLLSFEDDGIKTLTEQRFQEICAQYNLTEKL